MSFHFDTLQYEIKALNFNISNTKSKMLIDVLLPDNKGDTLHKDEERAIKSNKLSIPFFSKAKDFKSRFDLAF